MFSGEGVSKNLENLVDLRTMFAIDYHLLR